MNISQRSAQGVGRSPSEGLPKSRPEKWLENVGDGVASQRSRGRNENTLEWRVEHYCYKTGFPKSVFVSEDGRIVGTWIMGNNYQVKSRYYGGYPAGYMRRIKALFPEKSRVLHLFSGIVDTSVIPGDTVDINVELAPTYVDDAQSLSRVPLEQYDLVMADPPYSVEDAERYQVTMVKRNKVMEALGERLSYGAHVVWLDQVLPMYRKDQFRLVGVIGMVKSTNHRFRMCCIFQCHRRYDAEVADTQPTLAACARGNRSTTAQATKKG